MKKYYKYADSRGRVILATSHTAGQNYMNRVLDENENAVFSGEVLANPENLEKIERGVYKYFR